MQSTPTESRGLRLPQALWQRIDSEAEATGMSTNELLKRRLTVAFDFDSKVQKTPSRRISTPADDLASAFGE